MIKMKTNKVLINGYPYRQILKLDMLEKHQLPTEYIVAKSYDSVYKNIEANIGGCRNTKRHSVKLRGKDIREANLMKPDKDGFVNIVYYENFTGIENYIPIEEPIFQLICQTSKQAGQLLHSINTLTQKKYPGHTKEGSREVIKI